MGKFITVVDYGLGNLRSVAKALEAAGARVVVSSKATDISKAAAVVLPGVGAFKRAMDNLKTLGILDSISAAIKEDKPFLGICLGLQVLFTESEEHGRCRGMGIFKGKVRKFPATVKIPHMGWNQIRFEIRNPEFEIFKDIPDKSYFYFVHSYYVEPEDKGVVVATTEYGKEFASVVNKGNIWGMQFHPEKSQNLGLKVLENFCRHVS